MNDPASPGVGAANVEPERPISGVLLEFARPLLEGVGLDSSIDSLRAVLQIAVVVWNAVTVAAWGNERDFMDEAERSLVEGGVHPVMLVQVRALAERKRTQFGDDLRGISEFQVERDEDGALVVRATAHAYRADELG